MNSTHKARSIITDISGTTTAGTADVTLLDSNQKLIRSLKRSGIFFALAVVSILVPMLHFVLVPAFLILSGIAFAKTMAESKIISLIQGECPSCHRPVGLSGSFKMSGTKESCPECRQLLRIHFEDTHG